MVTRRWIALAIVAVILATAGLALTQLPVIDQAVTLAT
jgi:hypothetical protein